MRLQTLDCPYVRQPWACLCTLRRALPGDDAAPRPTSEMGVLLPFPLPWMSTAAVGSYTDQGSSPWYSRWVGALIFSSLVLRTRGMLIIVHGAVYV